MKPLIQAAIVAVAMCYASQVDASVSCSDCQCGHLCRTACAVREAKPVRKIAARTLRGAARIVSAPFRALRWCE